MNSPEFLGACRNILGPGNVITAPGDMAPYLTDWRGRFTGKAVAVLRPASTQEVAAVVAHCARERVSIVPQGGNTGLVLGSVPDAAGNAVVLSLKRLNSIGAIDLINNTITVGAGSILEEVQNAASDAGRLFPLSLAAEGSCTIGGNLATNAGGTAVLRYGSMRDLCLGLEVVTADGEIWNGLRGLRKDNTGYDLRNLYIGAEGTLGIITAAVLKLFPQPRAQVTAMVGLNTPEDALRLLTMAQATCAASLTGFELMSQFSLSLVSKHFPQMRAGFSQAYPQYVLLEISDGESEEHATGMLESLVSEAMEHDVLSDAIVASSIAQSKAMWSLREHITLAQAAEGKHIKHDVSVPISSIADFINETDLLLQQAFPACRMVTFGHLGDGNLHYNVSAPEDVMDEEFIGHQDAINQIVHDSTVRFGGSISAEHGLGMLKRDEIKRYKSPVELSLMSRIKEALDPLNIMNPGKVL
ncbi:MAG: FAD-binding oxidoreductase [Noviherbaspirillum sp.]